MREFDEYPFLKILVTPAIEIAPLDPWLTNSVSAFSWIRFFFQNMGKVRGVRSQHRGPVG